MVNKMKKGLFVFFLLVLSGTIFAKENNEVVIYSDLADKFVQNCPVSFYPDGTHFITSFGYPSLYICDTSTGTVEENLDELLKEEIQNYIKEAGDMFKPWDERYVQMWMQNVQGSVVVSNIFFSPDGKNYIVLLSSMYFSNVKYMLVIKTATNDVVYRAAIVSPSINKFDTNSVCFFKDGKLAAVLAQKNKTTQMNMFSGNCVVSIIDIEKGRAEKDIQITPSASGAINNFGFTFDSTGEKMAAFFSHYDTSSVSTEISIHNAKDDKTLSNNKISSVLMELYFTSNGKYLYSNGNVWDAKTFRFIKSFSTEIQNLSKKMQDDFLFDGKNLVKMNEKAFLSEYAPSTSVQLEYDGKPVFEQNFDLSRSGKYLAYANQNGTVFVGVTDFSTNGRIDEQKLTSTDRYGNHLQKIKAVYSVQYFDDGEWISMTEDGYYNSSPKGDEHINIRNGLESYGINQFSRAYYHPEVIDARMNGVKESNVVEYFGDIKLMAPPPLVSVEQGKKTRDGDAQISVTILDAMQKFSINDIHVFVNGKMLGSDSLKNVSGKNLEVQKTLLHNSDSKAKQIKFSLPVKLEKGNNLIEVTVSNEACYGAGSIEIEGGGSKNSERANLYLLAIGINDYDELPKTLKENESGLKDLSFAVSDSAKITDVFSNQKIYSNIYIKSLSDVKPLKPSKNNIMQNLSFFDNANENDVCVLYIAAHGITKDGEFYFLPKDVKISKDKLGCEPETAINTSAILDAINVPGRKIVFIDTCQSGSVNNNIAIKTLENRSTVILAAARETELAQESKEAGGHFTYAITECIKEYQENSEPVTVTGLCDYVNSSVTKMSRFAGRGKIRQHPEIYVPAGLENFIIAK